MPEIQNLTVQVNYVAISLIVITILALICLITFMTIIIETFGKNKKSNNNKWTFLRFS